jgi:glycosyltransferase involved in cell wall biosynthesis
MPEAGKAGRGRVLCVLPATPLPVNTGGRIRTWTLVRALDRAFALTVAVPIRGRAELAELRAGIDGRVEPLTPGGVMTNALADLRSLLQGTPLRYGRYSTRLRSRELEALTSSTRFDIVHFDHLHMAQLFSAAGRGASRVLDAHNVESLLLRRYADTRGAALGRLVKWQAQRVEQLEARIAREVDLVLACSIDDAAAFGRLGASRVEIIPNPVPPEPCPAPVIERSDIVLVGSFDWPPNADAAHELAGRIWPACRNQLPATRLVFVGRAPPRWLLARQGPALVVTGEVPEVRPYLARAWATAIPLRAGSGTRIKILEAWSAGVPVVATRLAAEGLPYRDGENILLAEGPEQFAKALVMMRTNQVLSQRLRQGGRAAAAQFSEGIVSGRLVQLYESVISDKRERRRQAI